MTAAMVTENGGKAKGAGTLVIWQVLALLAVLLVIATDGNYVWDRLQAIPAGSDGFVSGPVASGGFARIEKLTSGGAADRAGLRVGDFVHYDHAWEASITPRNVEPLTVRRDGAVRHVDLITTAPAYTPAQIKVSRLRGMLSLSHILGAVIGGLIILRAAVRPSVLLIGAALACNSLVSTLALSWLSTGLLIVVNTLAVNLVFASSSLLFFAFARRFRLETTGRDGPVLTWLWRGLAALMLAAVILEMMPLLQMNFAQGLLARGMTQNCLIWASLVMSFLTMFLGWRDSQGEARSRYALLMTAMGLTMMLQMVGLLINSTDNNWDLNNPLVIAFYGLPFLGLLLFAYAILRHRVIDIGFAVNQTLIYGVVSFVVLLLFGLAEWGIEKIMPHEWHEHIEANAFISAGIALCIFLVFHRIRDGVEHVIEGVFFHKWRANEAQLHRFVRQAAHMLKPGALKAAAVAEFARFSGGAEVALYSADGQQLVRDAGDLSGLAVVLDADLGPLVEMRAEGRPLFAEGAAPLCAGLVLPMIQRNDLKGFIALGPKAGGDAYRPDERQALADAAHKIGLDLHALRIEELETEAAAQKTRADILADILEAQVQQGLRISPA